MTKHLPPYVIDHIRNYAKPLTRPDWKTRPKFTFELFFYGIKKQNKYILWKLYYKVVMGYCHHYILDKYKNYIKSGYNKDASLNKLHLEYGLNTYIICLMCNI